MKKSTTRRALLMSLLSLVLCMSMLVGTTFAWFTDSVSSGKNTLTAGNLDVALEYSKDMSAWADVEGSDSLFDKTALWEPGHTEVVYLKISNLGSLALKYQLGITITNEIGSVNVYGDSFKLSTYLRYGVIDVTEAFDSRDAARTAVSATALPLSDFKTAGELLKGDPARTIAVVVYMPDDVTDAANYRKGEAVPTVELGISVTATQLTAEKDSFGNDYDGATEWYGSVSTAWYDSAPAGTTEFTLSSGEELAGFAKLVSEGTDFAGKTVKLSGDLDLNGQPFAAIGKSATWDGPFVSIGRPSPGEVDETTTTPFRGVFDGQGHTIRDLYAVGGDFVGLFGILDGATVKNVSIVNATVIGNRYVGVIAGCANNTSDSVIENVSISGLIQVEGQQWVSAALGRIAGKTAASVSGVHIDAEDGSFVKGSYAAADFEGDSVGGIVGQIGERVTVTDVSVTNLDVSGSRKVGAIAGMINSDSSIDGATVDSCTVAINATPAYCAANVGKIIVGGAVGEYQGNTAVKNVSVNDTTVIGRDPDKTGEILGGNRGAGSVTTENLVGTGNTLTCEEFVFNSAAAQAALDEAKDGDVIQLVPGVDYGTLYIRPNVGNTNTVEVDYRGATYGKEYERQVRGLTVKGAESATVDGIIFDTGYDNASGSYYYLSLSDFTVDGVTFTDAFDGNATGMGYNAPLLFNMTDMQFDGVTVKDCTLIGNNDKLNFVYLYNDVAAHSAAKNLTISGCTVSGIARLCELRQCENVTIENNRIENTALHGMLLTAYGTMNGGTYTGDVIIKGNTIVAPHDRYIRMAQAGSANVVIEGNTFVDYRGADADFIKITDATGTVTNKGNVFVASTTEAAQAWLDSTALATHNSLSGNILELAAGTYGTLTVKNFWGGNYSQTGVAPITIRAAKDAAVTVGAIDLNGMNFVTIEGLTFDAAKAIQVYAGGPSGDYGSIVDSANDESKSRGANHITVKNCIFSGSCTVDVGKYCPINFMGSNPSSWTYNITVSGCKFLTNAQNFIRMNNVTNHGSVLIENNVFGGEDFATNHHAINASANGGDWTITGNTFVNWNPKKCAFATGRSSADGTTDFVITGNVFSNTRIPTAADGDDGVIEIKTNSYTTTNYTLDFSGNTFAGALAGLDESTVKWVKP